MDRRGRGAILAVLVLLSGVVVPGVAAAEPPPDPETDVKGWEGGYWHNESVPVDPSDGLSPAERRAFVNRIAARIEILREREFNSSVSVEVISRAEFRNQTRRNVSEDYRAWNNQVWEALFIVGEDRDVQAVLHEASTDRTTGAYFFEDRSIKIVANEPGEEAIGRGTLAHELVHANQDQYHDMRNLTARAVVQDEQLALNGLIEGEARYLELRYEERCGVEWDCVPAPAGGGGDADINLGVYFALIHPYSDGPPYVRSLIEAGEWEAVEAAFREPPNSTEQVIHRTEDRPVPLAVDDEATGDWSTFPEQGRNGTDTAGEASMFAMLWYQADQYDADTIPRSAVFGDQNDRYDLYDYRADPTAGWGNDAILPYRRAGEAGTEYGYVWVSEWDTVADAMEFRRAYLRILAAHDARRLGPRTLVVDDGPFADAFRVAREGSRVTIVNAPGVEDLGDVRPTVSGVSTDPATTQTEPVDSPREPEVTTTEAGVTTAPPQPGLGILAAIGGLVGWLLWRRRP